MPYSFWDTVQTKGIPGRKKVTEDRKNALIERAVSTWKSMGLTDPQIAFATTVMGHKSGFDANAGGTAKDSDEYGLGQFTQGTWGEAVKDYNKHYKPGIDNAVTARKDPDAQIRVIGAWVPHIWDKAGEIAGDRNVKGYSQEQIAYGKWNQGPNAHPKEVGDYLKGNWHDPDIGGYFDTTYDRAMQGLSLRRNYLNSLGEQEGGQADESGRNNRASVNLRNTSSQNTKGQQTYPGIPTADQEGLKEDFGPYAVAGGVAGAAIRAAEAVYPGIAASALNPATINRLTDFLNGLWSPGPPSNPNSGWNGLGSTLGYPWGYKPDK